MHVILAYLGAIVTILVLLNRLSNAGIDIGWLDPFKWNRRRKWRQKYYADPLYSIDDPMEATACLLYTMVRCSGDISLEEKKYLQQIFQNDFQLSEKEATELLSNCSYQIKDENTVFEKLEKFINPSISYFTDSQKESVVELVGKVAECAGQPTEKQLDFKNKIESQFTPKTSKGKW